MSLTGTAPSSAGSHRRFQPKGWAFLLALAFAGATVWLGNWQGDRAQYKLTQQTQLDAALAAPPLSAAELASVDDAGTRFRYRKVNITGQFADDGLFFVDNRINDGKAGYVVLQVFAASSGDAALPRYALVDRGWMPAPAEREILPKVALPNGSLTLEARINVPPSRNPGTFDNDAGPRLNYINIDELSRRTGKKLEPYLLELTAGTAYTGIGSAPPGFSSEKNRIYQFQWYAFAMLAVVLFVVLSFRKQEVS